MSPAYKGNYSVQHECLASLDELNVKIYADGADFSDLMRLSDDPMVKGFTTNPTLMKEAGISDYKEFARGILGKIITQPISFEVFSDDFSEMKRQALEIASWGKNVYVKIPVTNSKGESSAPLIKELSSEGVQLNVTAVLTLEQVETVALALSDETPSILSVFAGRIADTGRDPVPIMREARKICDELNSKVELLWASPREVLNLFQADQAGCHIITMQPSLLKKLRLFRKDLGEFSLETVQMFKTDAESAGYEL